MDIFFKTTVGLVILYSFYAMFLFCMQRQVLFPKHIIRTPAGTTLPAGVEKIPLHMPFGTVESWYMPTKTGPSPLPAVIFAHGNGELIDFWPETLRPLNRMGLSVLLVEYPGYGRSEGEPSQETITATMLAAHEKLSERKDVDSTKIVYMGRSLGGGAVCSLARSIPPKAIVLMSTFTDVTSFASRFLMPGFLVRDPFDNLATVENYTGPILFIHGKHDEVIPYAHSQRLVKAAKNGVLHTYECGHNDCPPDWRIFWKDLSDFLRKNEITEPI